MLHRLATFILRWPKMGILLPVLLEDILPARLNIAMLAPSVVVWPERLFTEAIYLRLFI